MRLHGLGALVLGAALALSVAAADGGDAAHVDVTIVDASADGSEVTVAGSLDYGGPSLMATDGTGDVSYQEDLGTDLSQATMHRDGRDLVFTLSIADGLPLAGGVPNLTQYGWDFKLGDTVYALTAWRGNTYQRKPVTAYFGLQTCQPNETGGQSCSGQAVPGEFTETEITWRVPWSALRYEAGAVLETVFEPIHSSLGAAGAVWFGPGTFAHDEMPLFTDFSVGGSLTVELLDEAGDVVASATADGSDGAWSVMLPAVAPGTYTVRATSVYGGTDMMTREFTAVDTDTSQVTVD